MLAVPGKVTALITRRIADRVELCVFDHAGFVQLPAGTLEPGERPLAGVVREAWEETGLPYLEVVAQVAAIHDEHAGAPRHVFHLRATAPTPDEWWVLTPDGGGSQWRCRWVDLAGVTGLHEHHQSWLDAGRDLLAPGPAVDRAAPPDPGDPHDGATELFDATNEVRLRMRLREGPPPAGEPLGSSYGICVTAAGDTVVVTKDAGAGWGLPGGRPEPGESAVETLVREVAEEACARVLDHEVLANSEDRFLDHDRNVVRRHFTPVFWARVELDEWAPKHETVARRLVPIDNLANELRWEIPDHLRLLALALAAEARRAG